MDADPIRIWYPGQITQRELREVSKMYNFAALKQRPTPGLQGTRDLREWLGLTKVK